ncbi:tRNA (cytidine(34)-2'-O)-methyltransferase [Desulfobaculum bizertense]|uniref:Putative tRNA (cytidine(34)-2'-O)-methyltransferase n=1 Tax=Desulfobaculum bizertense DSM 18034 TaxID=1121442 RepID=A0A1T4WGD7_9BACT|nr:tRNA (cytidine(34)-2'-O)-methyltransferase [Desulfobaculum bizertense]UIJ39419.1 tRNA (cytidine(34)-2'-O)-methyltransferase [Desulfobaculum bizertense]SKA76350.1 tRNA (cytidine/uridine-2'-O-)-methyltransferase [Desulfobaculum bizertense DSM 18034]
MEIVLYEPEIPPNTGNIARLCAATKTPLHLVEPLGFSLENKYLKRAGLDYWPYVDVTVHPNWEHFLEHAGDRRIVATSSKQGSRYDRFGFEADDIILMGPETRGLPEQVIASVGHCINLPIWGHVRSLNLSTSTGIILYEAMRQADIFPDIEPGVAHDLAMS